MLSSLFVYKTTVNIDRLLHQTHRFLSPKIDWFRRQFACRPRRLQPQLSMHYLKQSSIEYSTHYLIRGSFPLGLLTNRLEFPCQDKRPHLFWRYASLFIYLYQYDLLSNLVVSNTETERDHEYIEKKALQLQKESKPRC